MEDRSELRMRAHLVAERYFKDFKDWSTPVLIGELETRAYEIAREGDSREATSLFMLVAELSAAQSPQLTLQIASKAVFAPVKARDGDRYE